MHHPTDWIVPWPLSHQLWSTGWKEKELNGSIMRHLQSHLLSCHIWDGACKIRSANGREKPIQWWQRVSSLTI